MLQASTALCAKLHPRRFPGMSGKMAALVGYLTGEPCTSPVIAEVVVTSDGCVLGRLENDCGCNEFLGRYEDLHDNFVRLARAAGLSATEQAEFDKLYATRVGCPVRA